MLTKFQFQGHILNKYSHIKFNEYPPSGSRVVPYGLMDGRREEETYGTDRGIDRDTTKLIVAFRNFAHATTNYTTVLTRIIPSSSLTPVNKIIQCL
jgi:hypothetical protein